MPPAAASLPSLTTFLLSEPHHADNHAAFIEALASRLIAAGVPVWRLRYALLTMHPEVLWRSVFWRADEGASMIDQAHQRLGDAFYMSSPVAAVRESLEPLRVRLETGESPYPLCVELREQGGTDFLAQPLPFTNGEIGYVTFVTQVPGGFSDEALELLEALRPSLARRIELESAYYATRALLEVYLGKNAARRVLAGQFQRGGGEPIDAAIWFSDMRGFTQMSDRVEPKRVIEILDRYFDGVAGAISDQGGEVLKFVGDAVLAIFPFESDARGACQRALAAAEQAFAALARVNERLAAEGDGPIDAGIALHCGRVMYGNIGARDRLDFTVISAAVNEASRLESLCKPLGVRIALSAAFVETAEAQGAIDLGEQALRGVRAPVRVFTLAG
ncbi:MAG TPA: adenylate/guanylate cyclase domain-containing protein [Polyangiaceae bacterium]|jgi:adenylate cyclase|nr:adenylate/guanylate cyclase domain-containing protein [Polyangiaceae bacterium]